MASAYQFDSEAGAPLKRKEVVTIRYVQTILNDNDYRKIKVLALDLDSTLRELLQELLLIGYNVKVAQAKKEDTNG